MADVEVAKKILEKWNNGTLTGAQRKLSKALNISESKISDCLAGRANPSANMKFVFIEVAKFNKKEDEIRKIFGNKKEDMSYTQNNIRSKGNFHQVINEYKSEALSAQMRALEAKIDLLIQLVKEGK